MDLGSIFLILALLVLVVLYISRPFFEKQAAPASLDERSGDQTLSALLAERDRIINALQELDFDFTLGKIPEEDYPPQRAALLARGADTLRKLDALQATVSLGDAEDRLEAAIQARRADLKAGQASNPLIPAAPRRQIASASSAALVSSDDDLEMILANRRRERKEKAAGFCPKCGNPVHKSDLFCPKCGTKVN